MIRQHYLRKRPGISVLSLGLSRYGMWLGLIVYALPPKQTIIRYGGETWELARLWVSDEVPANAESWFIAKSIKYIKKNHPTVKMLVSYADPTQGHEGTIYKASNWRCDGMSESGKSDYVDARNGKKYGRKGHLPAGAIIQAVPRVSKNRYIYPLAKPDV